MAFILPGSGMLDGMYASIITISARLARRSHILVLCSMECYLTLGADGSPSNRPTTTCMYMSFRTAGSCPRDSDVSKHHSKTSTHHRDTMLVQTEDCTALLLLASTIILLFHDGVTPKRKIDKCDSTDTSQKQLDGN